MSIAWGLTEEKEYWVSSFSGTGISGRRKPLLWTCRHAFHLEQLLREQAQIYDPFIGFALPQGVVTCLGVLNSRSYSSPRGLTIELLPLEPIPNPVPLAALLASQTLTGETAQELAACGIIHPLETSHWSSLKSVIAETNPLLTPSLLMVENWHQRQKHLERILEMMAQRGCSEEAEQELFTVLRNLTRNDPNNDKSSGQLALQTRLRVALKAQLLPAREWEELCKRVVDAWYGYVMTLTPQEVTQLTDLDREFNL
jgi:hypothetical protein